MMNILVVNQSVIDMCAAFFSLPLQNDIRSVTGLSHDSAFDQFVCRFWMTDRPLWCMMVTSTYGIVLMTLSRYIAVIYPIRYKIVRTWLLLSNMLNQTCENRKALAVNNIRKASMCTIC